MVDETKDFLRELGLAEGTDINHVEQKFIEVVKGRIQAVAETYDEDAVKQEEQRLRDFHKRFFTYTISWAQAMNKRNKDSSVTEHQDAAQLKSDARKILTEIQSNIVDFATCYMHINRFVTLLRDEMKKEETRSGGKILDANKYTADVGLVINRYKKEKREIMEDFKRLDEMEPILKEIDTGLRTLRKILTDLQNAEKADKNMRSLIAALRTQNFMRAEKVVKDMTDLKKRFGVDKKTAEEHFKLIEITGQKVVSLVYENAENIIGQENKLYLRPSEADITRDSHRGHLKQIKKYLSKYHLPYMKYKVDSLFRLKDKLMVVGSLEGLMTLYKRLIMGLVTPLDDIKKVRMYESEVLDRAKYLMEAQFQEVPIVLQRAQEAVEEFHRGRDDYEQMIEMDLETPDKKDQAASG